MRVSSTAVYFDVRQPDYILDVRTEYTVTTWHYIPLLLYVLYKWEMIHNNTPNRKQTSSAFPPGVGSFSYLQAKPTRGGVRVIGGGGGYHNIPGGN